MMKIIVPLCREAVTPSFRRLYGTNVISVSFRNQMNFAVQAHCRSLDDEIEFAQKRFCGRINDGVHSVEAQYVDVEVTDPIQCILGKKTPYLV
ncbi:MAG TPA: hypothetical protein VN025_14140, partial [Candidatus Dormibacteraeota bacterium]|nr:hypothetical protein [Candidatus Dormibacteraeota bacterium]